MSPLLCKSHVDFMWGNGVCSSLKPNVYLSSSGAPPNVSSLFLLNLFFCVCVCVCVCVYAAQIGEPPQANLWFVLLGYINKTTLRSMMTENVMGIIR